MGMHDSTRKQYLCTLGTPLFHGLFHRLDSFELLPVSRGQDDGVLSVSRVQDDGVLSVSRGQDDGVLSVSRGQDDDVLSVSRGQDDGAVVRFP